MLEWTKYGKRYSRGESRIVMSSTVLFSTDLAHSSRKEGTRWYIEGLELCFTESRSGESPGGHGKRRLDTGPGVSSSVVEWTVWQCLLVTAPQIKNVYMRIHSVSETAYRCCN
jgi:hypothetical protein